MWAGRRKVELVNMIPLYREKKWKLGNSFGWWKVPYCPHCKRQLGMLLAEQKPNKCPMCNGQLDWRSGDGKAY